MKTILFVATCAFLTAPTIAFVTPHSRVITRAFVSTPATDYDGSHVRLVLGVESHCDAIPPSITGNGEAPANRTLVARPTFQDAALTLAERFIVMDEKPTRVERPAPKDGRCQTAEFYFERGGLFRQGGIATPKHPAWGFVRTIVALLHKGHVGSKNTKKLIMSEILGKQRAKGLRVAAKKFVLALLISAQLGLTVPSVANANGVGANRIVSIAAPHSGPCRHTAMVVCRVPSLTAPARFGADVRDKLVGQEVPTTNPALLVGEINACASTFVKCGHGANVEHGSRESIHVVGATMGVEEEMGARLDDRTGGATLYDTKGGYSSGVLASKSDGNDEQKGAGERSDVQKLPEPASDMAQNRVHKGTQFVTHIGSSDLKYLKRLSSRDVMIVLVEKFDKLDSKIDKLDSDLNSKIDKLRNDQVIQYDKLNSKIDKLRDDQVFQYRTMFGFIVCAFLAAAADYFISKYFPRG